MSERNHSGTGHGSASCEPLLEACTPEVYRGNAFRVTGLSVDATVRDIKRRLEDLKAAMEMGESEGEHTHAFALDETPGLEQIRAAAQKLQDPEKRIVDEFFWFWPFEWGQGYKDAALAPLRNGHQQSAFATWTAAEAGQDAARRAVAVHNIAVLYHLVALDWERVQLTRGLDQEQLEKLDAYWRAAFQRWEMVAQDETVWSVVTARIRALDDPRLTTGFARRLRSTIPVALDNINAALAIRLSQSGNFGLAKKHLEYMKETHQGLDDIDTTLELITEPMQSRIRTAIEAAESRIKGTPEGGAEAAKQMLDMAQEPLLALQTLYPASDPTRADLFDAVAECCLKCQIAYARKTEDWETSKKLLTRAAGLAHSEEVKEKLKDNLRIVTRNDNFDRVLKPFQTQLEQITETGQPGRHKLSAIKTRMLPLLEALKRDRAADDEVRDDAADALAAALFSISCDAHNEEDDDSTAVEAIALAASLVRDRDLKKTIERNAQTLNDMVARGRFEDRLKRILEGTMSHESRVSELWRVVFEHVGQLRDTDDRDEALKVGAFVFRALAIKACNEWHRHDIGMQAIDAALGCLEKRSRPDPELRARLQMDRMTAQSNLAGARSSGTGGGCGLLLILPLTPVILGLLAWVFAS